MRHRSWLVCSPLSGLIFLAWIQFGIYIAIVSLSPTFAYGVRAASAGVGASLALLVAAFVAYAASIGLATRIRPSMRLGWAILLPAILFRCLLLFTPPLLEIDVYRYLWDGAVTAHGVNPYIFPPGDVRAAEVDRSTPIELQQLIELRNSSPELDTILARVHYGELPTVYPLTSQAMFAVGAWITPPWMTVDARLILLKCVLLTFDVGTVALVWKLLTMVGRHPGWTVCYAWCPLVLKEFANSGHLDSIAVFLTTAGVYLTATLLRNGLRATRTRALACGVIFGLAIGAKLYAIVLLPLVLAAVTRVRGPLAALLLAIAAAVVATATVAPMLLTPSPGSPTSMSVSAETAPTASGFKAFLSRWEMNDFLFMLVVENVRPQELNGSSTRPWFAIVPDGWRYAWSQPTAQYFGVDLRTAGFLNARAITLGIYLALAAAFAWRSYRVPSIDRFLEAAFLTLAWFWLLAPTQNPWYWTWAMPLLPFARGRAWYALSGLAMLYYLRFLLREIYPHGPAIGTAYDGEQFFDYVIVWLEFAPWFAWLGIDALRRAESHSGCGDKNVELWASSQSPVSPTDSIS